MNDKVPTKMEPTAFFDELRAFLIEATIYKKAPLIDPNAAAFDTAHAATYIGTTEGSLKKSRATGELFKGVPPPLCIQVSSNKYLYKKVDLDEWLSQFKAYATNAERFRAQSGY